MDSQQVQVDKKQVWGKMGTAPVPANVSAKRWATSTVSLLMATVDPRALAVPALGFFLILQLHQAVFW